MNIRNTIWLVELCFLGVAGFAQEKAKDALEPAAQAVEDRAGQQLKRIQSLVDLLDSDDPEVKKVAMAELKRIGKPALIFLEEKIARKGAGEAAALVKQIVMKEARRPGFDTDRWIHESDLKKEGTVVSALSSEEARKYAEARFKEARSHYDNGRYDQCMKIASALLDLEPRSELAEELFKLKRVCDQKILQQTLVKAQILVDKEFYEAGETVTFTFRISNVSPHPVTIRYASRGVLYAQINNIYYDPLGLEYEFEGQEPVEVEQDIPIASGAQWEKRYAIDTGKPLKGFYDLVSSAEAVMNGAELSEKLIRSVFYRTYSLEASTVPSYVEVGGSRTVRKIVFEPAVARVGPKGSAELSRNSAKALMTALEAKTPDGIFISTMMLKKDQFEMGAELLVSALKKYTAQDMTKKYVVMACLRRLTGMGFDYEQQWIAWWDQKSKKQEKKP